MSKKRKRISRKEKEEIEARADSIFIWGMIIVAVFFVAVLALTD